MHIEILQDMPGNCPECGMNLVIINDKQSDNELQNHSGTKFKDNSALSPNVDTVAKIQQNLSVSSGKHKAFKNLLVPCIRR